jgi:chromobox protein 1
MPDKKTIRPLTTKQNKNVYIINKLIQKRKNKGKIEYLVDWKGFDESDQTWEPRTQLIEDGMIDMIKAFETEKQK